MRSVSCEVTGDTNEINQMVKGICHYTFSAPKSVTDNDCNLWLCLYLYNLFAEKLPRNFSYRCASLSFVT